VTGIFAYKGACGIGVGVLKTGLRNQDDGNYIADSKAAYERLKANRSELTSIPGEAKARHTAKSRMFWWVPVGEVDQKEEEVKRGVQSIQKKTGAAENPFVG
jgi:hypothetical protein